MEQGQWITGASSSGSRRAIVICDQWLGSNGYAGMKALRRAGWAVHVIPEWEYVPVHWRSLFMRALARGVRGSAVREFNNELVRAAAVFEPELIIAFKGMFVRADALRTLRSRGVRSYCFYPDVSTRTHGPYLPEALASYDHVFTTKRFGLTDLAALGVRRASFLNHAFDPELHRPVPLNANDLGRYACEVSFIGTWSPKKERLLTALKDALPALALRIWGAQWYRAHSANIRDAIAGHTVEGEDYVRAIRASSINLALLSERREGASSGDQVTSRTFHIPACGGFMLHERTAELLELFTEGESVAAFEGEDELSSAVEHWLGLDDERGRIARCALEEVRRNHSWDHRITAMLAHHAAAS